MKTVLSNFHKQFSVYFREFFISVSPLCTLHFALCTIFALCVFPAAAHTFHTSLTRIDYDEKEKLAEISMQLFTHDLVSVLEKQSKDSVNLEKTPNIDKLIFNYLSENFVLKDKNDRVKKLNWVGKEVQADTIYVYLEIPLTEDFNGFNLENTIFFESYPEQTNLVIARAGEEKFNLFFKVGDKFKELAAIKAAENK